VDGVNKGTKRIDSFALADYSYNQAELQPGTYTIELKAGDVAMGRNVFVDVVKFPSMGPPPDPGKIVFNQGGCGGCEGARIWRMNPDGSERQQIDLSATNVASFQHLLEPTLSPDGTKIAFVVGNCSPCRLYVANVDGSNLQVIEEGEGLGNPSWSPDGTKLVYQKRLASTGGNIGIIVESLNGHQQTIASGSALGDPNWSSTNKIVFNDASWGLLTVNPDGTNVTQVVPNAAGADWSPDGSKLVYTSPRNAPQGYPAGLYISNADGSGEKLLTGVGSNASPTWSSDGNKIAFKLNDDLYTIGVDGTGLTNITNTAVTTSSGYEHSPDWGPSPQQ
jgi:Tol biopolymer transport system component